MGCTVLDVLQKDFPESLISHCCSPGIAPSTFHILRHARPDGSPCSGTILRDAPEALVPSSQVDAVKKRAGHPVWKPGAQGYTGFDMRTYPRSSQILERNRRHIPGGMFSLNRETDPGLVFVKGEGAASVGCGGKPLHRLSRGVCAVCSRA